METTYSIYKKRLFGKDKLIKDNLTIVEAFSDMSILLNHYTIGIIGFPYYIKDNKGNKYVI